MEKNRKTRSNILDIINVVADNLSESPQLFCDYQILDEKDVRTISRKTKLELNVTKRVICTYDVWHAYNKHSKDSCPLQWEDFGLIFLIVNYSDSIKYGGKTKAGLDTIVYEKEIGNRFFVVEEVRTGRKKLAFKTMYKIELKSRKKRKK